MSRRLKIELPTPAEDAAITAAALSDPDALPLTDVELAQFKRAPGRPRLEQPKVFTGIRLDADIVGAFKTTGKGWQTRMNDALRDWLKSHRPPGP